MRRCAHHAAPLLALAGLLGLARAEADCHQHFRHEEDMCKLIKETASRCLAPHVEMFSGQMVRGKPTGRGSVLYELGGHRVEGALVHGAFHGKVRVVDADKRPLFAGLFAGGRAHGPAWLFGIDCHKTGFVHAHFVHGKLQPNTVTWLSPDLSEAITGTLVNGSFLAQPRKVKITEVADVGCVKMIAFEDAKKSGSELSSFQLPIIILTDVESGRIDVRTTKVLIFNRIAKTGSQSVTELMMQLRSRSGVAPRIDQRPVEFLLEPPEMVADFVAGVVNERQPTAWVRHYNFVDFEAFGAGITPTYINVVRDPVDKVISWFYYWRAAWNIVERKNRFPDEPLPDPEFLRKDFDTCVRTGDPECQYVPGSSVLEAPDHRSQVMAFCGHDPMCAVFGSAAALARAKDNVERHYAVVGDVADMNRTLRVLEARLPQYFAGAVEMYAKHPEVRRKQHRNAYKMPVADDVMAMVRANFTAEIEFYEFCRQRLKRQDEELRGIARDEL